MKKVLLRYFDLDRPLTILDWIVLIILGLFVLVSITKPIPVNAQTRSEIESVIVRAAKAHRINPELALAIAEIESQFDPNAKGSLGEVGLFQLRPEYHRVVSGNIQSNVDTAMKYLAQLKQDCRQYQEAFFVCFNYGTARTLKHPRLFPYYKKVSLAMKRRKQVNVLARNDH